MDVGFGDAITPQPEKIQYPALLDFSAPEVLAYPKETVIAEKLQAIVVLGRDNSRMKDFFDLAYMADVFEFDGSILVEAIRATFERRHTDILSETPVAFTADLTTDHQKQGQWKAFLSRTNLDQSCQWSLDDAVEKIATFLTEPLKAAGTDALFDKQWTQSGVWE